MLSGWNTMCRSQEPPTMTERVNQAAGILRQHDTLGLLPIPDVFWSHTMLTSTSENAHINLQCNNRYNCYNSHNLVVIAIICIIVKSA